MTGTNLAEELTTEHELYLSVGLKPHAAMKPSTFKKIVDDMLFENIGYMQSWGTHTKTEYISIIDSLQQQASDQKKEIERLRKLYERERELAEKVVEVTNREMMRLEQHVNTLTEALVKIRDGYAVECGGHLSKSEMREIADKALQSIKESPREEQGK